MNSPRILVIGSVSYIYILEMKRIPKSGENIVERNYIMTPGGTGGNAAIMLSRIGCSPILCTHVANDSNGRHLIDYLGNQGVDTRFVSISVKGRTGMEVVMLTETESNRTVVYRGANELLDADDVETAAYTSYPDAIFVQLSAPRTAVSAAVEYAEGQKIPVYMYAGYDAVDFPFDRLGEVKMFIADEKCVTAITGETQFSNKDYSKIIRKLADYIKSEYYVIKLSNGVSILFENPLYYLCPPINLVEVIDPSTAADTYAAAFTRELIFTKDINRAAKFASIIEAMTISGRGGALSIPKYESIPKFITDRNIKFEL